MLILTRFSRAAYSKKNLNCLIGRALLLFLFLGSFVCKAQTTRCSIDYDSLLFKNETVTYAETAPTFAGGVEGLLKFRDVTLAPLVKGPSYKYVTFIIDTMGQVRNVCIVTDLIRKELSETEKRIINAVKAMPKWTPAISRNVKVPVLFGLPLNARSK